LHTESERKHIESNHLLIQGNFYVESAFDFH